jgi:hypothetical protein
MQQKTVYYRLMITEEDTYTDGYISKIYQLVPKDKRLFAISNGCLFNIGYFVNPIEVYELFQKINKLITPVFFIHLIRETYDNNDYREIEKISVQQLQKDVKNYKRRMKNASKKD